MADPISNAILGKVKDNLLGKFEKYVIDPIERQVEYMLWFNSNIKELETQFKKLGETRQGVQMGVDENRRNGRVVGPNVEAWLTTVDEVTTEVEAIIQDKDKVKEGFLNGWCPNLKLHYSLSRKAVEKTTIVVDLWKDGEKYTQSSYPPPPASLETIPQEDFTGFESRRLVMEQIIEALKHDDINLIGICGMGGTGKTTMAKEVAKRAKEDSLFVEVPMAVVGQEPNPTNVQDDIADMLGLKDLRDTKSPIVRANLLCRRLLQDNKKILVILDDIWVEMDLKGMGFPLGGANKNFKMLYTSRTQHLWPNLQIKKEIPLELLSEDEAWQLFREKAGDSVDAPDLHPIAKKIANGCGRLPLALVIIGSTLSKKSKGNFVKELWEDMLDRLTFTSGTPADKCLSTTLKLSYNYVEDDKAKLIFLLCCLFEEDKNIIIEDLVRYGLGLSFFDETHELTRVRNRVFSLVDDLKSRYLLQDGKDDEFVKVHDVVRGMGISIASSKDKGALVIHGALSEWPKKELYDHYAYISVVSGKIKELPIGLTCRNLEFLLLECSELKELPHDFFEGMEKLKVLALNKFGGIATFQSLRNLQTLSFEGYRGCLLDNVSGFESLLNLEILSFGDSDIRELSKEIGELANLRMLDLRVTYKSLKRIAPGVISRLVRLEELYVTHRFKDWEGEGKEEGRNANLREFESLTKLNTLEIAIRHDVLLPKFPIFSGLKKYKVLIFGLVVCDQVICDQFPKGYKKQLVVDNVWCPIPLDRGGIDSLVRAADYLFLSNKGCNGLVGFLSRDGVDGLQQLKRLEINYCDAPEFLANTILNSVQQQPNASSPALPVFPILEELKFFKLPNLREICRGPVPAGSFGKLHTIRVTRCDRLGNLFQLPMVGCLTHLKELIIRSCAMMEEVFCKEEREDVHVMTNRIEFPNLKRLEIEELPSLVGFCRGIEEINFPQLTYLKVQYAGLVNINPSSDSEQNDKFGFLSIFPQKVTFPLLEQVILYRLKNVGNIWGSELLAFTFSKLTELQVKYCWSLRELFNPSTARVLVNLQKLKIEGCSKMEAVVGSEEEVEEGQGKKQDKTLFPHLRGLELDSLPNLRRFCHFTHPIELPLLSKIDISKCPRMDAFSLGQVTSPCFSFECVSWNGDLNDAIRLMLIEPTIDALSAAAATTSAGPARLADRVASVVASSGMNGDARNFADVKPRIAEEINDKSRIWKLSEIRNPSQCRSLKLPEHLRVSTKISRLIYSNSGNCILALAANAIHLLWKWPGFDHNSSGMETASVAPQLWQPSSGILMTNVFAATNPEDAVPCFALSKNDAFMISASGGKISLFNTLTFETMTTFMPPPPAATFLAFYPQDNNIIAIGMDDSTILIYNVQSKEVNSRLKGHSKRITGLAFSHALNVLVSSGADAQLCVWNSDTWEKQKTRFLQIPGGRTPTTTQSDTRVQFHQDQTHFLVVHETLLSIYEVTKLEIVKQWAPRESAAPISHAMFSCDSQLVYASFLDGSVCVFTASNLQMLCRISSSAYLSPSVSNSNVQPLVIAAHPQEPNQFAIGLSDGRVHVFEPLESEGKWGFSSQDENGSASSVATSPSVGTSGSRKRNFEVIASQTCVTSARKRVTRQNNVPKSPPETNQPQR